MAKAQVEIKLIQDTVAIILSGLGLLLILALVSYERSDIGFFTSPANDPKINFIGPVGAYVAAGLFLSIGLAAYLVPFVMITTGVALALGSKVDYRFKFIWLVIMMASGAGLMQFTTPMLGGMIEDTPPGGALGWLINDRLLTHALGAVGSAILLAMVYVCSLILLFEIKPIKVVSYIWEVLKEWYRERERARIEAADPIERIEIERKKLAKQEQKLRKRLKKEGLKRSTNAVVDDEAEIEYVMEKPSKRRGNKEEKQAEKENESVIAKSKPSSNRDKREKKNSGTCSVLTRGNGRGDTQNIRRL